MAILVDRKMIEDFLNWFMIFTQSFYGNTLKLQIYTTSTTVPTDMDYDTISGNIGGVYTPLLGTPFVFDITTPPTPNVDFASITLPFPVTPETLSAGGTPAFYILYSDTGGWIGGSGKAIVNLGSVTDNAGAGPLKLNATFPLTAGQSVTITDFTWSMAGMTTLET